MAVVDVFLGVVKAVVFIYDIVTFPVYQMMQRPWEIKFKDKQPLGKVRRILQPSHGLSYVRELGSGSDLYDDVIVRNKVDTVTKAFQYAVQKNRTKECLGTREVLGVEDEVQKSGKVFQKLQLGEYKWMTYEEVDNLAEKFGLGLRSLGLNSGSKISMFSETRAEWMISCLGAFSQNIHICTVYTNLGEDGILHAMNETGCSVVVTSHDLMPKFEQLLDKLPHVTHLIYFEDQLQSTKTKGFLPHVKILPFRSVVHSGEAMRDRVTTVAPTPDDTAIIMYTSGSTGTPKGVVLAHRNLVATMKCLMFMVMPRDDIYIAFLPLAHVLELLAENTMMLFGVKVGYSSPNTMTDMSTKVRKGYKGDATELRPTMMCAVPLIMDRIYKNVLDSVNKRGPAFKKVFEYCYEYKRYWMERGRDTPICDRIVFNKIRALLGGRMWFVIVGGAPLSKETHEFIRTCLGLTIVQGYSLTESCCTGTVMENSDMSTGTVGRPMTGVEVKLVDWEEGNYRTSDKPRPRGEVWLSGEPVAKGYYNMPDLTRESIVEDPATGQRWFKTGDVGEFDEEGQLTIIDRKKDLVKLQLGEYVSLGKVEAQLKTHSLVENICVYGDPYRKRTVAIVVPSRAHVEALANRIGMATESFEQLCSNGKVRRAVLDNLNASGSQAGLQSFELPVTLTLSPEPWTPEGGLITAAFKLKRKVVQAFFQADINRMYEEAGDC